MCYFYTVLFPLSGVSYCTGYLFIILIYTIVKLNVLLLLCISIYSIACVSYLIHCVVLFDGFSFSFYSLISHDNYH